MNKLIRFIIKTITYTFSKKRYLVLGDSHSMVFDYPLFRIQFPFKYFDVNPVQGATISGIENPNSKTNAHNIFKAKLRHTKKVNKIILLIGEVDTGFVIWYKAEKHNIDEKIILNETIKKYKSFINYCGRYAPVIVVSAPLPTIKDDNNWGEIANLRKEIKANQQKRTQLTLDFNKSIKMFCVESNIEFIDLDKYSLGQDGLVHPYLLNRNKNDHHYDKRKYSFLLGKNIRKKL